MTGDRDMFQCADDSVTILYVRTGKQGAELVDAREVRRRYGVPPELVPDFIALRGDPSDGIPGAKGIGEDRRRAASAARLAGGRPGARRPRDEAERPRGAHHAGGRAAALQGVQPSERGGRAPAGRRQTNAGAAAAARERGAWSGSRGVWIRLAESMNSPEPEQGLIWT